MASTRRLPEKRLRASRYARGIPPAAARAVATAAALNVSRNDAVTCASVRACSSPLGVAATMVLISGIITKSNSKPPANLNAYLKL